MKKTLIVVAIVLVALVALAVAGFAYAQSQTPPINPDGVYGPGMMGGRGLMQGRGMMGGRGAGAGRMGSGSYGPMHEYMVQALAEALGMTPEDLQTRIEAGETPYQIAKSQGLSDEEIRDLMEQAHDAALQAAVEAGVITQDQADWMDAHHEQMWQNGGPGSGLCHGGSGSGPRWRWNNPPTQPSA